MPGDGPDGWGAPLHALVLDAAGVRAAGAVLLDLGCGRGEFARAAADRGALVTGIDAERSAVAAAAELVPEGRFAVGDVHDPPPGPFDVVTAVQVLAHVVNPVVVLRGAARVGAVVAVTVWGREDECDVRVFGEALARWLPPRPSQPGPPPVTDPDRLRTLARLAGLAVDGVAEVVCPFDYPDADALLAPLLASGLGRTAARRAGPGAVRAAVLERAAPLRRGSGYRLENLFRVLVAHPA